jgi:O-antigen ligase
MLEDKYLSQWHSYQLHNELAHFTNMQRDTQAGYLKRYLFLGTCITLFLLLVIGSCTIMKSPLISLVVMVAFLLIWLVFRYPWLALLLVLAGAGLPSLTVPLPGHTMRPVEAASYLCLLLVFILRPRMRVSLPHILALLFMAVAAISFIHVPEISTSATVFGANKRLYDLTIVFLALFCGTFLFGYVKNISSFLSLALLTNIPLYLISLAQALGMKLPIILMPNQDPSSTGDAGRLVGSFSGAAEYGIYLTGMFAVALCCWLLGTGRRDRMLGACMTLVTLLAIVGSGTRSALLATALMLVIALFVTGHIKLFVGFLGLALAGFAAFPNAILAHFTHAQTSTSNRLFLWNEAIKLIEYNPVIGIGLEQFHYYYNALIVSESTQLNQHGVSVHNQYLEWALEGGIPWLILGVLFLLSVIVLCSSVYGRAQQEQRLVLLIAILSVTAVLVTSFLDVPFDSVEGAAFICLLIGLALSQYSTIVQYSSMHYRNKVNFAPALALPVANNFHATRPKL